MLRSGTPEDVLNDAVGKGCGELQTPALLLRRDLLRSNLERMQALVAGPTWLRPHAKTHKCPQVAALELATGAIGVTTATVWEAAALAAAGLDDILIANEVVGQTKVAQLVQTGRSAKLTVAVDSDDNARELAAAATNVGAVIGVLVDVDVGLGRCGVRSRGEGVALARRVAALSGLELRGVMGFEGHCTFEPDPERRAALARKAIVQLLEVADAIEACGMPIEVVSAGGTGTFDTTGANPRVTELQAGSYAFMDTSHAAIVPGFDFALTVLSTVISRHGPTVILDAGQKTLGVGTAPPQLRDHSSTILYVAEEHTALELKQPADLKIGDRIEIVPSYCPLTVNLHDAYFVVEDGVVVDVWPILARGAGWSSLGLHADGLPLAGDHPRRWGTDVARNG